MPQHAPRSFGRLSSSLISNIQIILSSWGCADPALFPSVAYPSSHNRLDLPGGRSTLTGTPDFTTLSASLDNHLQEPLPDFLYHYTSQEGLLGIIGSASLWATNISYMNDVTEFDVSLRVIRDRLSKEYQHHEIEGFPGSDPIRKRKWLAHRLWTFAQKIDSSDISVVCFCEDGDLLSQWRGYGSGYGYSLGFLTNKLKELADNAGFVFGRCIYNAALQAKIVDEIVESLLSNPSYPGNLYEFTKLLKYVAFFKNELFKEEREWRLVSFAPIEPNLTNFRKGKSMIVPYTSFDLAKDQHLSINHVYVGPCPHNELSRKSVEEMLLRNNINVWVHASSIPFRDW